MTDGRAAQVYERVKGEVDGLDQRGATHHEWVKLTTTILEAVMQCQALVIERQRAVLDRARSEPRDVGPGELRRLRAEAKDALYYVERLTRLYAHVKAKLAQLPHRS